MGDGRSINRRDFLRATTAAAIGLASGGAGATPAARDVFPGLPTRQLVESEPRDLAGNRIVFTNWYWVRPGDFDWLDDQGKSVYQRGNSGPFGAHYKGFLTPRGIRIVAEKAQRLGPLDRPSNILQDGKRLCAWYRGGYWESTDGLHWDRKADTVNSQDAQVFIDPSAPAEERYKCVWLVEDITPEQFEAYRKQRPDDWEPHAVVGLRDAKRVVGIRGGVSSDGLRWRTLPDPLVIEYSDTELAAYYDTVRRSYVIYTRKWVVGPYTSRYPVDLRNGWTPVGRRSIGRTESDDFRRFPVSRTILETSPDMAPADVLYTPCRTAIPGAPDHHVMFPTIWHEDEDDTSVMFLSSHDSEVWHYVPGGPVLQTQPFGQWDGGAIWVSPSMVELPDGTFALPYRGDNFPHKYPGGQKVSRGGYAIWPKGRLVALEAVDQGEFSTVAFIPPGRKLLINAVTKRVGSIHVEVRDIPGRSFADSIPIVGDQYRTPVTWKDHGDMGQPDGKPIVLSFRLNKAKLYGLEFA